jgi:hypothetical protein
MNMKACNRVIAKQQHILVAISSRLGGNLMQIGGNCMQSGDDLMHNTQASQRRGSGKETNAYIECEEIMKKKTLSVDETSSTYNHTGTGDYTI